MLLGYKFKLHLQLVNNENQFKLIDVIAIIILFKKND